MFIFSFPLAVLVLLAIPFMASADEIIHDISVSSSAVKGSVNSAVSLPFTIRSLNGDCSEFVVALKATNTARAYTRFTGTGSPAISVHEEGMISWRNKEIHTGDSLKFTANAKIMDGAPGQIIDGFLVMAGCKEYQFQKTSNVPKIEVVKSSSVVSSATVKSADVKNLFKQVYGRNPNSKELAHWNKRVIEKKNLVALKGAMNFQKAKNSTGIGAYKK